MCKKLGFYTEELLHKRAFTQKSFYTEELLHKRTFTQKSFYTKRLLHKKLIITIHHQVITIHHQIITIHHQIITIHHQIITINHQIGTHRPCDWAVLCTLEMLGHGKKVFPTHCGTFIMDLPSFFLL